jgi:hypothetical protein
LGALPVASACAIQVPPILLDKLDRLADFHGVTMSIPVERANCAFPSVGQKRIIGQLTGLEKYSIE